MPQGGKPSGGDDQRLQAIRELFEGRYTIDTQLPCGGLAVFYAGEKDGRRVAIGLLPLDVRSSKLAAQTFTSWAERSKRFRRDDILPVTDSGIQHDVPFVEFDEPIGQTLWQRVDRGPLAASEAAALIVKVIDALEASAVQGHEHWDLTPANVLLRPDGSICLVGLGIAPLLQVARDNDHTGPTGKGSGPMARRFLAPEFAAGLPGNARSECFSLAALALLLVTGEPPDRAGAISAGAKLPDSLRSIIERGLAQRAPDRYPELRSLREALLTAAGQTEPAESAAAPFKPPRPGASPSSSARDAAAGGAPAVGNVPTPGAIPPAGRTPPGVKRPALTGLRSSVPGLSVPGLRPPPKPGGPTSGAVPSPAGLPRPVAPPPRRAPTGAAGGLPTPGAGLKKPSLPLKAPLRKPPAVARPVASEAASSAPASPAGLLGASSSGSAAGSGQAEHESAAALGAASTSGAQTRAAGQVASQPKVVSEAELLGELVDERLRAALDTVPPGPDTEPPGGDTTPPPAFGAFGAPTTKRAPLPADLAVLTDSQTPADDTERPPSASIVEDEDDDEDESTTYQPVDLSVFEDEQPTAYAQIDPAMLAMGVAAPTSPPPSFDSQASPSESDVHASAVASGGAEASVGVSSEEAEPPVDEPPDDSRLDDSGLDDSGLDDSGRGAEGLGSAALGDANEAARGDVSTDRAAADAPMAEQLGEPPETGAHEHGDAAERAIAPTLAAEHSASEPEQSAEGMAPEASASSVSVHAPARVSDAKVSNRRALWLGVITALIVVVAVIAWQTMSSPAAPSESALTPEPEKSQAVAPPAAAPEPAAPEPAAAELAEAEPAAVEAEPAAADAESASPTNPGQPAAGPLSGELPAALSEALAKLASGAEFTEEDLKPLYNHLTIDEFDARGHLVMARAFMRLGWGKSAAESYARAVRTGEGIYEDPVALDHLLKLLAEQDVWNVVWPAIRDGWRERAIPAVDQALIDNTGWGAQQRLKRLRKRLDRFAGK